MASFCWVLLCETCSWVCCELSFLSFRNCIVNVIQALYYTGYQTYKDNLSLSLSHEKGNLRIIINRCIERGVFFWYVIPLKVKFLSSKYLMLYNPISIWISIWLHYAMFMIYSGPLILSSSILIPCIVSRYSLCNAWRTMCKKSS